MASTRWAFVRAAIAVGAVGPVVFVIAGLFGVPGAQWGWLLFALAFGVPTIASMRLAWGRRAPRRGVATVAVAVLVLALSIAVARVSPYTHGRLHADLGAVALALPRPWQLIDVQRDGNTACLDVCPSVSFVWELPRTVDDATARAIVTRTLQRLGFTIEGTRIGLDLAERGRLELSVSVDDGRVAIRAETES